MTGDEVGDDFDWLDGEDCVTCGMHWSDCEC